MGPTVADGKFAESLEFRKGKNESATVSPATRAEPATFATDSPAINFLFCFDSDCLGLGLLFPRLLPCFGRSAIKQRRVAMLSTYFSPPVT